MEVARAIEEEARKELLSSIDTVRQKAITYSIRKKRLFDALYDNYTQYLQHIAKYADIVSHVSPDSYYQATKELHQYLAKNKQGTGGGSLLIELRNRYTQFVGRTYQHVSIVKKLVRPFKVGVYTTLDELQDIRLRIHAMFDNNNTAKTMCGDPGIMEKYFEDQFKDDDTDIYVFTVESALDPNLMGSDTWPVAFALFSRNLTNNEVEMPLICSLLSGTGVVTENFRISVYLFRVALNYLRDWQVIVDGGTVIRLHAVDEKLVRNYHLNLRFEPDTLVDADVQHRFEHTETLEEMKQFLQNQRRTLYEQSGWKMKLRYTKGYHRWLEQTTNHYDLENNTVLQRVLYPEGDYRREVRVIGNRLCNGCKQHDALFQEDTSDPRDRLYFCNALCQQIHYYKCSRRMDCIT